MAESPKQPSGLLLVDKPQGITSHDAVNKLRRAIGVRKVGHAGTLDPMATGLLVAGVGRATRLLRFLGSLPKVYEATIHLGVETSTLDATGEVLRKAPAHVSKTDLEVALTAFQGDIEQSPPAYSAVKVGGRRLYSAARMGEQLSAPLRRVRIDTLHLRRFDPPFADLLVECSGGTYIRSLAADIGNELGCGAHLAALRRTAVGSFRVEDAVPPDEPGPLLPLERAVEHLPSVTLDEEEAKVVIHGCCLGPAGLTGPYRAMSPDERLIGIWRDDGPKAVPEVVLAPG